MLGTNDAKPDNWNEKRFLREFEAMVQELTAAPWPHRLVLMTPPKAFPEEQTGIIGYDIELPPIRDTVRPAAFSMGLKYGLQVIDLFALTEEHTEYFDDGVHPNIVGNKAIAGYLAREIQH